MNTSMKTQWYIAIVYAYSFHIMVTEWLHSGYIVVTQWLRSGYVVVTQWLHSGLLGSSTPDYKAL